MFHFAGTPEKMPFQSFFMLTTTHPAARASDIKSSENVPIFDSVP